MKMMLLIGLALVFATSDTVNCIEVTQHDQCPPWFFYNTTTNKCECYTDLSIKDIIKCTEKGALLRFGYCTTYEEDRGVFLSTCHSFQVNDHIIAENKYIKLPENVSELNDYMCGPMNRKGRVCSQCIDGFGVPVFSLIPTCSNCTGAWYGVPLYLFLEFVPITVFYFIILCFRLNVTSAPMVAFVFYCQIGVSTLYVIANRYIFDTGIELKYLTILTTFYGFWNLDFFRYILPPFCVSPNIKTFHLTYLFYVSAVYPLCLTTTIGICIKLYASNNRPIVWLWNKIDRHIFRYISKRKDVHNTMIDVIATFFLLSYAKLMFIFVQTVTANSTFNLNNITLSETFHVSVDPSVGYSSNEHILFAVPSTLVFLFTIVPSTLLLALYPIKAFRLLLFRCRCSGRLITAINIFVDKFYSSYRDGLDGRRDMRWLISLYFVLRLLQALASQFHAFYMIAILYTCCAIFIATVRPYKKVYKNIVETLILTNLALIGILSDQRIGRDNPRQLTIINQLASSVLIALPLIVLVGYIIYKCTYYVISKLKLIKKKERTNETCSAYQSGECSGDSEFPDRVLHPEEYETNTLNVNVQHNVL